MATSKRGVPLYIETVEPDAATGEIAALCESVGAEPEADFLDSDPAVRAEMEVGRKGPGPTA